MQAKEVRVITSKTRLIFFLVIASACGGMKCKELPVNSTNSSISFPYQGAYINATRLTITGVLLDDNNNPVSNETVEFFFNDLLVGTTKSNKDGVFVFQYLPDGQYSVTVLCRESRVFLGPNIVTIDTTVPSIAIVHPAENKVIRNNTFTVAGITGPNAMVETFLDEDIFGPICYSDDNGDWSIDYTADSGLHTIKAQATDRAGNQGPLSAIRSFTITALQEGELYNILN